MYNNNVKSEREYEPMVEQNMEGVIMERPRAVEMDDIAERPNHPFAMYENENTRVTYDEEGNVNVTHRPDVPLQSVEIDFTVVSSMEDLPF